MTTGYHETDLSDETRDLHRGIASLIEELEAIDWYQQRVDVARDEELKAILSHHRDEEIEHAVMNFEWLRRRLPVFDGMIRRYLFSKGPIVQVEEKATARSVSPDLGIGRT